MSGQVGNPEVRFSHNEPHLDLPEYFIRFLQFDTDGFHDFRKH